jgi:hypothetical protein
LQSVKEVHLVNVPSKWAGRFSLIYVLLAVPLVEVGHAVLPVFSAILQVTTKLLLAARRVRALHKIRRPLVTQLQLPIAGAQQRVPERVQTQRGPYTRESMEMTSAAMSTWLAYLIMQIQLPGFASLPQLPHLPQQQFL